MSDDSSFRRTIVESSGYVEIHDTSSFVLGATPQQLLIVIQDPQTTGEERTHTVDVR